MFSLFPAGYLSNRPSENDLSQNITMEIMEEEGEEEVPELFHASPILGGGDGIGPCK